jgi:hypothetical protein
MGTGSHFGERLEWGGESVQENRRGKKGNKNGAFHLCRD